MSATEKERNALLRAVAESLGQEAAETLAELLPDAGARPATKRDIDSVLAVINAMDERLTGEIRNLEERFDGLEARFEGLERRFDGMDARFEQLSDRMTATLERRLGETITTQTRMLVFTQLGAVTAIAALVLGLG